MKKVPEYLPIPSKAADSSHPGRTLETKAERELRYAAQLISEQHAIPLLQALEIANCQAESDEKTRREQES